MSANLQAQTTPYAPAYAGSGNPTLLAVARILIAALFLVAGVRKLLGYAGTVGYFTKLGFPAADAVAVLAIVIEIGGALLLIAGWRTRLTAWVLVAFVAVATAMAHRFWEFEAAQQVNQMNHVLKNLAVIGGLIFVASFGPGRLSVDKT